MRPARSRPRSRSGELGPEGRLDRFQVQLALGNRLADEGGGDSLGIGALHQQQPGDGHGTVERLGAARGARRPAGELQGTHRQLGEGGAVGGAQLAFEGRDVGGGGGA